MFCFAVLGILRGFHFDMYRWTYILAFYLGWLAAPLTHLLFGFVVAFFRGTQILAGGIGVARVVVGSVFLVGFRFRANLSHRFLLVTRLGLMPCSAWSKKNRRNQKKQQEAHAHWTLLSVDMLPKIAHGCSFWGLEKGLD